MLRKSPRGEWIWDEKTLASVQELRHDGLTWAQIARQLGEGITESSVQRAYHRAVSAGKLAPEQEEVPQPELVFKENTEKNEKLVKVPTFFPVKTLEDAIRVAEVDLTVWYVYSWECRQWTTPMNVKKGQTLVNLKSVHRKETCQEEKECESLQWQPSQAIQQQQYLVSLKLRRKSPQVLSIESLLSELSSKRGLKLPVYKRKPVGLKRRAFEISIMDPHLGLRCSRPAADIAWSLDEAEEAFMSTAEQLIAQARIYGPFEEIVCPIGNDYFHADNLDHTTTGGTPQPEMEAVHETYLRGEKLMLWFTERLRREAPSVKLLSIPGNHDRLLAFTMARLVKAFYVGAKLEEVEVDASPSPYKFWSYGVNLIGFEHGHSVKPIRLAALMANETRLTHWQEARYCEWHLGDQHRKGSAKPAMLEEQGVSVEYLPSLTPPNEWHRLKSYNWQKRGAMGFIYDREAGPVARLQVNFDSYTGKHLGAAA